MPAGQCLMHLSADLFLDDPVVPVFAQSSVRDQLRGFPGAVQFAVFKERSGKQRQCFSASVVSVRERPEKVGRRRVLLSLVRDVGQTIERVGFQGLVSQRSFESLLCLIQIPLL